MQDTSTVYNIANSFAELTAQSIFLTGKAGTGKTTFLRKLKEDSLKQIAVVAPTGVAAINAGGVTMHSFFQLPFTPFVPTLEGKRNLISKLKITNVRRKVLQELELLVIDEISMVRADVLDEVDAILRHYRFRPTEAFGGVQVILIGDMYQLSPVVLNEEWKILSQFYPSPYFFHSKVIQEHPPLYIEFDKIFRQKNEAFIRLLNEVRNNCLSDKGLELLLERYQPDFKLPKKNTYIVLTTHNAKADRINAEEMAKIKSETHRFDALIRGDFPERNYPNEAVLELKVGAKVMFISNDKGYPRRYYNGKIGEISRIEEGHIYVSCEDDKDEIPVILETWLNIQYSINKLTKQIEEVELGSYTQYPLRLAWAITIHKSQGLTFEKAVIDAEAAFTSGQVYVALSRCRSLEGMILLTPIHKDSLAVDNYIIDYGKNKQETHVLDSHLESAKQAYNRGILLSVFDFKLCLGQLSALQSFVKENEHSFNSETLAFLDAVMQQIVALENVAIRFQKQLIQLLLNKEQMDNTIAKRIIAASEYFVEKIDILLKKIPHSPAETDRRNDALEYNETIRSLFAELARKKHIIQGMKTDYTTKNYYALKKSFRVPPLNVNAYALLSSSNIEKSTHPDLYRELNQLRRDISESTDAPSYNLVLSTKALVELVNYLPQTLKELKQIRGFGKMKIEAFGQEFLDVIVAYSKQYGLTSLIHEKPKQKRKKSKR
ncbi:MAG: HRDC domain-containing protein [Bacteroidales bacterium]|nr:HRDC domain-containing protein [Bacteroidales bacterium]